MGSVFDTTLGVAAASVDVTGIVAAYAHLMITVYARSDTAATTANLLLRFNGDAGSNYDYQLLVGSAAAASSGETFGTTGILFGNMPAASAGANLFSASEIFVSNYAGSTNNKQVVAMTGLKVGTSTTNLAAYLFGGSWRANAAINRVTILAGAGNLVAGTRVTIHALGA